jgi:peptide/nickel transport system permease protein
MTDMTAMPGRKPDGAWAHLLHVLRENPVTMLSFGMFAFFLLQAFFGALTSCRTIRWPRMPRTRCKPPNWTHWFGTDSLGRDVFSRVVVATRLDLTISVSPWPSPS